MAENTKGELEKLIIKSYTKPDYSGDAECEFKAYFNPDQYVQVYDIEYDDKQGSGTTGSPMVFKKIKPMDYTLKFMLDGTGVSGEKIVVKEKIDEFFRVVGYDGNIHRPRYLFIIWGTLESKCVLLKADITYKIFNPDGTPLRALVSASFRENIDDKTRVAKADDKSPDLTHVRSVKEGDSLPLLSYEIYGDPFMYLEIACVNKLNNFRELKVGQKLVFPPIDKEAG